MGAEPKYISVYESLMEYKGRHAKCASAVYNQGPVALQAASYCLLDYM